MNIFYYITVLICACLAYVSALPSAIAGAEDLQPAESRWNHGGGHHGGGHHGGGHHGGGHHGGHEGYKGGYGRGR
ncbi:holotricin-3-like [Bombyx mandarina]|uniref:Holotricin-3-like n=1 Tax=Bombyx mandarina TaxID=7092 RepID=A0A6J2JTR8_BOMMA|nr:holotricin-3-like [Bombyx mandarina]